MTDFINRIPVVWRALVVIATSLVIGFTVAATVLDIPIQVNANKESIVANREAIDRLGNRLSAVEETQRGILSTQREMLKGIQLGNCLSMAVAQKNPYQQCLDK